MTRNDFKAFATSDNANVLSQDDYEGLAARSSGFQSGVAKATQLNKVWRQSSIMSAVLAQFIADRAGQDAIDDGSTDTLSANLKTAIFNDTELTGTPIAPTPNDNDNSTRIATTAFVVRAVNATAVGKISFEARTRPRAGDVELNGALLLRVDYPELWAYAQDSGMLVTDAEWSKERWGCFSSGDGTTNFRIPEMRGEHIRGLDNGRGVDTDRAAGSWQDGQNRSHTHGVSASQAGNHVHSAWVDQQGQHSHGVNDPGHTHTFTSLGGFAPQTGNTTQCWIGTSTQNTGSARSNISLTDAGSHMHNVGIGESGRHSHDVTIKESGGNETRSRNIAFLATMRAY